MNYFAKEGERLVCLLCSHYCKIAFDKTGICGVNKNIGEKIECLVYGYPKALNIDPIEKTFIPFFTKYKIFFYRNNWMQF